MIEIPFENRFYHFYNSEKTDHSHLKGNSNPITYKRFREEQSHRNIEAIKWELELSHGWGRRRWGGASESRWNKSFAEWDLVNE